MLHLHLSNRPEALASALATVMRVDPLTLLETEQIVVPSSAAARWLDFRLADGLGIATQTAFPFPAAFVWQLFGRVLPDVAATSPFDRAALQWRLLRLLGASGAPEVRRYLAADDGTRQFELAGRVAALFDRYLVERPDWIAAWSAGRRLGLGPDENWQAALWHALVGELTGVAPEHPRERFLATLRQQPRMRAKLPRRVALWCVEAMPALYWEVFVGLAEWIELHVCVLAPSRAYWGDIDRLRARLQIEIEDPAAAALFETGHPLLASLGRARQPAVVRLADVAAQLSGQEYSYFAAPPATLLGTLQRDILELAPSTAACADHTLQLHACHGAQREAEVLLDCLLDLFERLPGLQPADILILTPDIETYAPIVAAVLTHAPLAHRIPCAIADRAQAAAPLWRAFRRLCTVAAGDFDAEGVMALLGEPALRRAFDLAESDLPRLRDWVREAAIRWGSDGTQRAQRGLPADDAYTWRAGLRRLLLGVALPDAPERLWGDLLPVAGIEGERAALLGRFADFLDALFEFGAKLGAGRAAPEWSRILAAALERFLAPHEAEEGQVQRLRAALATLAARSDAARCVTPLPFAVLLRELDAQLAEQAPVNAFASGMATIAALQPGRPLGARVVCLVGMNDDAWPRPATPLGFDLMAAHSRPGDRDKRGEERHAFLEALVCAGDALIVTFSGRDPRSNLALPPAAPLAELIDTLAALTGRSAEALVVQHPLQPFGAAYFETSGRPLFSFDAEHARPAATPAAAPFLAAARLLDGPADLAVELESLQRYYSHPVRYFLRECLGIHLEESEELLEIHEPFVPDALDAYRLRVAHFAALKNQEPVSETLGLLRARGWLPQGVAGALADRAAHDEALPLWQAAQPWAEAVSLPPCAAVFAAAGTTLSGRLDGLTDAGLWRLRAGRIRMQDRLRLWLDHLLLNIARPAGVPCRSVLIARDDAMTLEPEPRAAELLADLLALHRQGLQAPLPFYPETAWAWSGQRGWPKAWAGDSFNQIPGERDDPYLRLALRDRTDDPLGADFQALAMRICGPLRAATGK